jgi:hypothetical protein
MKVELTKEEIEYLDYVLDRVLKTQPFGPLGRGMNKYAFIVKQKLNAKKYRREDYEAYISKIVSDAIKSLEVNGNDR